MASVEQLTQHITAGLGDKLAGHFVAFGELTIEVNSGEIESVLRFLRDDADCAFTQLIDLCGADYP